VANKTASAVTLELTNTNDDAEMTIEIPANDTFCCETTELWDKGMKASAAGANVVITVSHSQDGV
jgi:hypothetical protein